MSYIPPSMIGQFSLQPPNRSAQPPVLPPIQTVFSPLLPSIQTNVPSFDCGTDHLAFGNIPATFTFKVC